ncbi:TPA_asm: hypothetical protein [Altiarchaeum virus]|nr:TPA_asm: hypothetical protein [Altiarchaeum virus]
MAGNFLREVFEKFPNSAMETAWIRDFETRSGMEFEGACGEPEGGAFYRFKKR